MTAENHSADDPENATVGFFAFAFAFTWLLQLPGLLAVWHVIDVNVESVLPLAGLGAFGPLIAAVLCSRRAPGGVRGLFRRITIWRVNVGWYLVALFGFGIVYVVSRAVYGVFGGTDAAWAYPPENAQHIAALVMMPLVEEIGWRGFAIPRLLQRHRPIAATLILGAAWSAWHAVMFLFVTTSPALIAISFINVIVGCFVFTWFFLRTRGSLLLAILLHVGAHLNNPAHAVNGVAPMALYTTGLAVVVVVLLVVDRRIWTAPHKR